MKKGVIIEGMKKPKTCFDCPFLSQFETINSGQRDNDGEMLFNKYSRCILNDDNSCDSWRGISWTLKHIEDFCPIKEYKGGSK